MIRLALAGAAVVFFASAGGATAADWKGSFDASYQAAQPGDTIVVPAGTISGDQVIGYRAGLANLPVPCTPTQTSSCVRFVMAGPVTVNGAIEIHGSSVWIQGGNQLRVNGYIDTEATSSTQHPDHVIVEGTSSVSFGVFNADTVTFRNMDVGPATAYYSGGASPMTCCRQGRGFENKIGLAGDATYVPRNVTLDGMRIHNQNGDSTRLQNGADVHFGGLFLVTVDGLTIRNSVFERNVVYHIQIQNYEGPKAKNVTITGNSFSCPVEWLYSGDVCDNQRAVQFDYDPGTEFTLSNNVAANGPDGLFGCSVGSCGGLVGVKASGNTNLSSSTTAPPLNGSPPPPPPPTCPGQNGGLTLTKLSETATTVTFGWQPVANAIGYRFTATATPGKYSHTWDAQRSSVKFSKGSACYFVGALLAGPTGGSAG